MKKLSKEIVKERIFKIHGDTVTMDESCYINTYTKCLFIDKDYGEWWAFPRDILIGKGHIKRRSEKTKKTNLERYGVECSLRNLKIQEKTKQTNLLNFGVENPLSSPKIQEQIKRTNLEKYGAENPMQNEDVKNKLQQTNIDKYGVACTLLVPSVQEKIKQTNLSNLGVENPFSSLKIQEKIKQTNLDKYGFEHPSQNPDIHEKVKQTNLERFGAEYPSQNPEIALKGAKASNNHYILYHWETDEEIVCVASYEKAAIEYLNENQILYFWQKTAFTLPDGRTYRPDFYLIKEGVWVEIKGYFRDDAKEKWEWFHKEYPNSELWNEEKLKEMGIL